MKLSTRKLTLGAFVLAAGVFSAHHQAQAQFTFSSGDLVVDRVGTGSATLSSASTAVFLDEYSTAAGQTAPIGTLALSTTSGTALTQSGSAVSEGLLNLSGDRTSLLIGGYNAAPGVASIASTTATADQRAIAVVSAGAVQTSTTLLGTSSFSTNNIRSAASQNGVTLYASGGTTGIVGATAGTNGSTTVSAPANSVSNRSLEILNGNLYFSTGSSTHGIYQVGTGLPTGTGNAATLVLNLGTTISPYGFSISPDGTTAFVADTMAGTISKYTLGGSTMSAATAVSTLTGLSGVTGLTVSYDNGFASIYAVTPTTLFSVTDNVSATTGDFGTLTTLATAATNEAFRGVDFAPSPVPEPTTILGGVLLLGAAAWSQRRRLFGLACLGA